MAVPLHDHPTRTRAILGLVALLASACSSTPSPRPSPSTSPSPTPSATSSPTASPQAADLSKVRLRLVRIASLDAPLAMAVDPSSSDLYIAEKGGRVRAIRGGRVDARPVLDIHNEVSAGNEQGLLGLAISPDGRYLYVNFTDTSGDTHVREYALDGGRATTGTAREVLTVDQPFANHNGGNLVFGPDGHLYIGLGDGGGGGDPHGNAQSLRTLLGKMLRIRPRPFGGKPYRIPPDNPFVGRSGARPEIWAFGLRNPWRYSFDAETKDLWIGDVGQSAWEEIDFQRGSSLGGENYGWDRLEGSRQFEGSAPPKHVLPVYEYANGGQNCAVTGGYVYRGHAIPAMRGAYVFGDACAGELQAFVYSGAVVRQAASLVVKVPQLASFGEGADRELYALSLAGEVFRLTPVN